MARSSVSLRLRLLKRKVQVFKTLCLNGLLWLAAGPPATAAETVRVSGFVMDSNKRALELANIVEINTWKGTSSDESGYYEIELPMLDTLVLRFSCLAYQTAVRIIPADYPKIQYNITLQTASHSLEDVSVSAQRHQIGSMQRIDASDIRLLPDPTGGSIEALLVTFAGVSSQNEMSTQYSVRGGNYDENLVYVNGTEIYRPQLIRSGQQEGLSFVNPQMTQSVEFSAGGFDACYGDKMSSVLDIRYKKPEDFAASANVSLLGANVYAGTATKDGCFTQIHGLRYKSNTYLLGSLETQGEYRPTYLDYQTYLTFRPNPNSELSFLGNISQNVYAFVPESRSTQMGTFNEKYAFKVYFDGQEKDVFETFLGAIKFEHRFSRRLSASLQTSFFRTKEEENYDITGQYWLNETPVNNGKADTANTQLIGIGTYHEHARNSLAANIFAISHNGDWTPGQHHLKWGVSWQSETIVDQMREWEMRDSAGYSLPYSPDRISFVNNLSAKTDLNNSRFASYIQDTWKNRTSAGLFTLTSGLRANWWNFNRELLLSPRLSISFIPAWEKDFTFRLAGGVYYQAPFYKEIRDTVFVGGICQVIQNRDIKAPRSIQLILGTDYHFSWGERPFKLTAEAYHKRLDHIIPYSIDNVRIRYEGINNGYGHTTGCDFKLFGEFVPGTDSWISLSLMDSKEIIRGYTVPRPNEQRYNVSMFFRDYLPRNPKYSMTLKLIWADGLCFGPPSMERRYAVNRMKAYRRTDIGLSRLIVGNEDLNGFWGQTIDNIWISLDCFNLFGIKNTNSYYWVTDIANRQWAIPNYLTGRQLNLSVSVDFH